jgi:autotransporter-associated beta strand protein
MASGLNTIQLKITDSAAKTAIVSTTVELIDYVTWDANNTGANQTDGSGAWLDANQWWDSTANVTWTSGFKAAFGNGGGGGNVTLASPTMVESLIFNAFSGAYTLGTTGQAITLNSGITVSSSSGAATINSPITLSDAQTWENNSTEFLTVGKSSTSDNINNGGFTVTADGTGRTRVWGSLSGNGGIIKNGPGVLDLGGQYQPSGLAHSYTGTTTINEGSLWIQGAANIGPGNLIINGGALRYYYGGTFSRSLGAADNQFQITGGISGFGTGHSGTIRIDNNSNFELVWGSTYFKPDELLLQGETLNATSKVTLSNKIDLNGATRTIRVDQTGGDLVNGYARITGIIRNTTGTAGIIKTGIGQLILNATNTYNGDTTVLGGNLRINVVNNQNETSTVSIAASATLQLNFTGTDTVNKLFIDGSEMSAGEYKAVGSAASGTELAQLTGTGTLTVISGPYESWSSTYGLTGEETLASAILHSDGLANLQKFAFGMDPTVANSDRVEFVVGGEVTAAGSPALMNMAAAGQADDERAVFTRLKNHVAAGLTYTVEFSADLKVWAASAATPTVLTDANSTSDLEVVSVPFVDSVPVDAGGAPRPPKFMRVVISNE